MDKTLKITFLLSGVAAVVALGFHTDWQTAALIFWMMWTNNVSQGD